MSIAKLLVAAGLTVAATGAFAETGVNAADLGYVANIYGRASEPAVKTSGPVIIRLADVNVAGREFVEGTDSIVVTTKDVDVNEVEGRS